VTIDRELVTRKLLLIMQDLEELKGMLPKDEASYVASARDQAMVERYLERMIGRAIDINYHLLTGSGEPPPPDYHSSFTRLTRLGVLEAGFAMRIASAAGLRNRLVHDYDRIDPAKVYHALRSALEDLPSYLRQIQTFLDGR
jgi:uncharacterized protein YutE (UPF0331/DUF86 family)